MLSSHIPNNTVAEIKQILEAEQYEIDILKSKIKDLVHQCFIETATWGLDYWEDYLGIPIDKTKTDEFRRSNIKAKIRGQGTTTKALIKNVAESFSNGEVDVIENSSAYNFVVKFVGTKGIPPNLDDLKDAIGKIKPSHLRALYEFTYNTWQMLEQYTWDELSVYTWDEISTMKITKGGI